MKIKEIKIVNFKRFTNLTIKNLNEEVKLVLIIGPNGCGKSSLFEAFNSWYKLNCHNLGSISQSDKDYYLKSLKVGDSHYLGNNINISFHDDFNTNTQKHKNTMYFRTAYRNQPDFNVSAISKMVAPYENPRIDKMIGTDSVVSQNYQRLINATLMGLYSGKEDELKVSELREQLIGKIRNSMTNVFGDLILNDIGDPLSDGSFFFKKGISKSFHYKNLSAGEKSAFDLLLDLHVKYKDYNDSIFIVDEPETHMHTRMQGKLVEEMVNIIPDNSQLWMSSHSLGVIQAAQRIAKSDPNKIAILDFSNINLDEEATIVPTHVNKALCEKFLSITLDDISGLIAPKYIVMCEGEQGKTIGSNFDSTIYSTIFSSKHSDVTFISCGSSNDLKNQKHVPTNVLKSLFPSIKTIRLVDNDNMSDREAEDYKKQGVMSLTERHLECYLYSDEILKKLADTIDGNKWNDVKKIKDKAIQELQNNGRQSDDIKRASGTIYSSLIKKLDLKKAGNTNKAFMQATLAPLVTDDTETYKKLENTIITPLKNNSAF